MHAEEPFCGSLCNAQVLGFILARIFWFFGCCFGAFFVRFGGMRGRGHSRNDNQPLHEQLRGWFVLMVFHCHACVVCVCVCVVCLLCVCVCVCMCVREREREVSRLVCADGVPLSYMCVFVCVCMCVCIHECCVLCVCRCRMPLCLNIDTSTSAHA